MLDRNPKDEPLRNPAIHTLFVVDFRGSRMVRIPHDHDPVSLCEYLKVRPKNESSMNSLAVS